MGASQSTPSVGNTNQSGNTGTVINHYYQQHYQNSMDLSGMFADNTSAGQGAGDLASTSSGGNGSTTVSGPASSHTTLDTLAGFVGQVGAAVIPALLADIDTENTTDMGDRVTVVSAGNTAQNSQSSVGLRCGYGYRPGTHTCPSSCTDAPTCRVTAVERGYTFRLTEWTAEQDTYDCVMFHLPGRFLAGANEQLRKDHYTIKCGWRIQVQCNASPFHAGMLGVFMVPELESHVQWNDVQEWSSFRSLFNQHQATTAMSGHLMAPEQLTVFPHQFINIRTNTNADVQVPYLNVTPTSCPKVHRNWTVVIMVLSPLVVGGAANVPITCTITPLDFVANGLRQPVSEGLVTTSADDRAMYSSEPKPNTPAYVPGWRQPADYLWGEVTDLMQIARIPTMCTLPGDVPWILSTNEITEGPLAVADVAIGSDLFMKTALYGVSNFFTQYRGTLQLDLVFTGCATSRGKFLVAYVPPGAEPTSLDEAMQGTYVIWDIGLNSTLTFPIPFISVSDYRYVHSMSSATTLDVDGWLLIYQLTALTYPQGAATVARIVVMVSAGSDFSLRYPCDPAAQDVTDNAETGTTQAVDATNAFDSHPAADLTVVPHTNVKFLFDRFFFFDTVVSRPITVGTNHTAIKEAGIVAINPSQQLLDYQRSPTPGIHLNSSLHKFLSMFTYYRSDLSVWLQPRSAAGWSARFGAASSNEGNTDMDTWCAVYLAPGAPTKDDNFGFHRAGWTLNPTNGSPTLQTQFIQLNTSMMGGMNPTNFTQFGRGLNGLQFTVPYANSLTALSTAYNGYGSFTRTTETYGVIPEGHYGRLKVFAQTNAAFYIYTKFPGMQTWAPRPVWVPKRTPPSATSTPRRLKEVPLPVAEEEEEPVSYVSTFTLRHAGASNFSLLKLAGDVEENPGPAFFSRISQFAQDASTTIRLVNQIGKAKKLATDMGKHWKKILKVFLKVTQLVTSAVHHDWVTFSLLCAEIGVSCLSDIKRVFLKILEKTGLPIKKQPQKKRTKQAFTFFDTMKKWILPGETPEELDSDEDDAESDSSDDDFPLPPVGRPKLKTFFGPGADGEDIELGNPVFAEDVTLNGVNKLFTTLRHAHWGFNLLKDLLNWIKGLFKPACDKKKKVLWHYTHRYDQLEQPTYANRKYYLAMSHLATEVGMRDIAQHWAEAYRKCFPSSRPEPVCVVLRGRPGQGKSVAATIIAQAVSVMLKGKVSTWSLPVDSDHFDGYCGQEVVVIDDLGQNPDGQDYKNFCQMVSSTVFIPPMASLNDKGMPFTSSVIIATTNMPPSHAPPTVHSTAAIQRRITFDINVSAKKRFTTETGVLDYAAAMATEEQSLPELSVFSDDCAFLNGAALHLRQSRNQREQDFTIYSLVQAIVNEVRRRSTLASTAPKIIAQDLPIISHSLDSDDEDEEEWSGEEEEEDELKERLCRLVPKHRRKAEFKRWFANAYAAASSSDTWSKVTLFLSVLTSVLSLSYVVYCWCQEGREEPEGPYSGFPQRRPQRQPFQFEVQGPYSGFGGTPARRRPLNVRVEDLTDGTAQAIFRNTAVVRVGNATGTNAWENNEATTCTGFFVGGRDLIMPRHTYYRDWTHMSVDGEMFSAEEIYSVEFNDKDGLPLDAILVRLPIRARPRRNRVHLLTKKHPLRGAPIWLFVNNSACPTMLVSGTYMGTQNILNTADKHIFPRLVKYQAHTSRGYCAAPVVAEIDGRPMIIGFHCAGNGMLGFATRVDATEVCAAQQVLDNNEKHLKLPASEDIVERWKAEKPVHVPRKTNLKPSPVYGAFPVRKEPAALSKFDPRLENPEVFDENILNKNNKKVEFHFEALQALKLSAQEYAATLFSHIGTDNEALSLQEAIDGIDGLDGLDTNTSPGLPYTLTGESRSQLLADNSPQAPWRERVERFLSGDYSEHVFQSFLKDELRTCEKVKAGNTRVVEIAAFDHVIVGRMLLGKFMAKVHKNNGTEIGIAVGCNPDNDWTKFAHALYGFNVYDVDYKNFDASHSKEIFQLLIDHVFTPENGFDPRAGAYIKSLCNSTHQFGGECYRTEGALPSGCAGTSILNCVINNIVTRAAIRLTYPGYQEGDITLLTYGDDLLLACAVPIDMDHVKINYKSMGYEVTPADKSSSFPKTSQLKDVSFLKRRFEQDGEFPYLFHPVMDSANLEDTIMWFTGGDFGDKTRSLALLAFHSGPEEYNRLFHQLKGQYFLPPWDVLQDMWLDTFGLA
nr:polyprotein [Picornaviridae sp.]